MGIEDFITKVKKGETPFYKNLSVLARKLMRIEFYGSSFMNSFLYRERKVRIGLWRNFWRLLYYQPMFRSRCTSCGKGLRIVHSGQGIPLIDGDVSIILGENFSIFDRVTIAALTPGEQSKLIIGDNTNISGPINILIGNQVSIGSNCLIGSQLIADNPGHNIDYRKRSQRLPSIFFGEVKIGNHVWAGYQSVIFGNVTIGDGAVIGARAVVTKDVPPFCVVMGNPAKIVKKVAFPEEMIEQVGEDQYRKYLEAEVEG